MNWQAMWLTVKLATLVSLILLVLGLPLAYWLARTRWRWRFLLESVVALPLVLPPTVLGYYVLVAMGSGSAAGRAWERWTGAPLAFSFEGLVVASVLYSLPFAVQPFMAAFTSVDPKLIAASYLLGASPLRTFFRVTLPLAAAGVLAGVVLAFAHTVGEFGVVLMVGGNIPGVTRTISVDVYDNVQALQYGSANVTAAVLLVFSYVVLALVYALNRWAMMPWRAPRP